MDRALDGHDDVGATWEGADVGGDTTAPAI